MHTARSSSRLGGSPPGPPPAPGTPTLHHAPPSDHAPPDQTPQTMHPQDHAPPDQAPSGPGTDPPVNRITDACENITFPQLRYGRSISVVVVACPLIVVIARLTVVYMERLRKRRSIRRYLPFLRCTSNMDGKHEIIFVFAFAFSISRCEQTLTSVYTKQNRKCKRHFLLFVILSFDLYNFPFHFRSLNGPYDFTYKLFPVF